MIKFCWLFLLPGLINSMLCLFFALEKEYNSALLTVSPHRAYSFALSFLPESFYFLWFSLQCLCLWVVSPLPECLCFLWFSLQCLCLWGVVVSHFCSFCFLSFPFCWFSVCFLLCFQQMVFCCVSNGAGVVQDI